MQPSPPPPLPPPLPEDSPPQPPAQPPRSSINEPPPLSPPPLPPFPVVRHYHQGNVLAEKTYYHESDLFNTPTILAGVPHAWERHYRRGCSMLITRVCINLSVPHVVAVAANDFVQRFYMRESMIKQDRFTLCCAAVLLAVKMCEAGVVRLKQLLPIAWREYCNASSINANQLQDEAFLEKLRARVILAERHILAVLGFPLFDARVDFPVPIVWKMAEFYKLESVATEQGETPTPAGLGIGKVAVNIVLDLLHTSVPITRPPEVLAAAALWLARDMLCPPGSMEPVYAHQLWFEHAGVSMEDIEYVVQQYCVLFTELHGGGPPGTRQGLEAFAKKTALTGGGEAHPPLPVG